MNRLRLCGVSVLGVLTWAAGAWASVPVSQPKTTPVVAAGRKIYEREKCATCHQIARQGNSRFPLDGVASRLSAQDLRRWMTDTAKMEAALPRLPPVRMSAMKYHLKPADLDALVAYLQTLR